MHVPQVSPPVPSWILTQAGVLGIQIKYTIPLSPSLGRVSFHWAVDTTMSAGFHKALTALRYLVKKQNPKDSFELIDPSTIQFLSCTTEQIS